jgi:hypothetical protein
MLTRVPAHGELVSWIETFEAMSLDERHTPIDPDTLATCLEMAAQGATVVQVRDWMRTTTSIRGTSGRRQN